MRQTLWRQFLSSFLPLQDQEPPLICLESPVGMEPRTLQCPQERNTEMYKEAELPYKPTQQYSSMSKPSLSKHGNWMIFKSTGISPSHSKLRNHSLKFRNQIDLDHVLSFVYYFGARADIISTGMSYMCWKSCCRQCHPAMNDLEHGGSQKEDGWLWGSMYSIHSQSGYFDPLLHRRWSILQSYQSIRRVLFSHGFAKREGIVDTLGIWGGSLLKILSLNLHFIPRLRTYRLHYQKRAVRKEKLVLRHTRITSQLVLTGLSSFSLFQ